MLKMLKSARKKIKKIYSDFRQLKREIEDLKLAVGRIEMRQTVQNDIENCEFKIFSQWGEDGIIQSLINRIQIKNKIFVEFGVENYAEANTRYLLINNNWTGLIIDGSEDNMCQVRQSELYWRYNLKAVSKFITKENINETLIENGIQGDIGLLSIDIDGNDYWVWDAISVISPRIVICEYNSLFGKERKITTPYSADFVRSNYSETYLVYGASIKALEYLGDKKGYSLVAGNSAGNNLFFVRKDLIGEIKAKSIDDVYVSAQFREGRNNGQLTYDDFPQRLEVVKECIVYDIDKEKLITMGEAVRLSEN